MTDVELIQALRRMSVETGSLICLGCGYEHNCSVHGCAIMRTAADMLPGWAKLQHKAQCEKGGARLETLWLNYEPQIGLCDICPALEEGDQNV